MPKCSRDPLKLTLASECTLDDGRISNKGQATFAAPRSNFSASALQNLPNDRRVVGADRIQHVFEALMPSRSVRIVPSGARDCVLKISAKPLINTCILSMTQKGGLHLASLHHDDGFILSFLLEGSVAVTDEAGRQNYEATAGHSEVINRRAGAQVTTSESHSRLMFAFPAAVARDRFEAFTQQPYLRPIEFIQTFDFRSERYLQLYNVVKCAVSDTSPDEDHRKKFSQLFEDLIFAKIFGDIPHNYTDVITMSVPWVRGSCGKPSNSSGPTSTISSCWKTWRKRPSAVRAQFSAFSKRPMAAGPCVSCGICACRRRTGNWDRARK